MMDLGQPMHAYDLARVDEGIRVRPATPNERLTLLDDNEYELDPDFLVIADARGAIGLAGVMGRQGTGVSDSTSDAAVGVGAPRTGYDCGARAAVRVVYRCGATVRARGRSDAAAGRHRACNGASGGDRWGRTGAGASDPRCCQRAPPAPEGWVSLRRTRLSRLLGASVPDDEVYAVLSAVSGRVESTAEGWRVPKPPHRFDIRIEEDLIEEVARLRGFDSIAESHAVAPQIAGEATESRVTNERLLTAMADRGYREVITYSFVDPALQLQLFPGHRSLQLANPISVELSTMRVSLWTGLVQACRDNLRRQQSRVRLFEIGKKFVLRGSQPDGGLEEIETLAGVATGARWPEQWGSPREALDFYDVKADVQSALALTGDVSTVRFEADALDCLRPGRAARIYRGSTAVGWLGELHPQIVKAINLPNAVFLFELEIDSAFKSPIH